MSSDDAIIYRSGICSFKMSEVLVEFTKGISGEDAFKVGTKSLSSLLATFIDAIVNNSFPDVKLKLVNEICELTKILLDVKNKIRENNSNGAH